MRFSLNPENLIALLIPLTYLGMVITERFVTGHQWPAIRGWQRTGVHFFIMLGAINCAVSAVLVRLFGRAHLFNGAALGIVGGTLVGYALLSFGNALMHRAYHRFDWLWHHVHRLHHVPRRLDVAGVMYQTPWEALGGALLFVLVTVFLLRLDPLASMLCAYIGAVYGMFQHLNIRTPRWLGIFIQRPEAHCLHHRRGVHAWNYSDLPLWDILWGTFRNPSSFEGELGLAPNVGHYGIVQ
jgi:sterol desaturase/sphingolipid hydroxylase (fatty acid hydroxylase superfamily)